MKWKSVFWPKIFCCHCTDSNMYPCIQIQKQKFRHTENALDRIISTGVCSHMCVIYSFSWICWICLHQPGPRHTRTVALTCFPVPFHSPPPFLFLSLATSFPYLKKNQTETEQMEVIRTHTRALCVCKPGVLQTSPQSSLRLSLIPLLYPQTALLSQPRIHDKEKLWRL